jgi:hypothetical protein
MTAKITPAARKARNARWTAQAAFGIGALLSIGANVTVSQHTPVGIITAVWAPAALLLTLALLENGSISGRWAKAAVVGLAAVAAWASYWHLVDFFTMGGADVLTAHLLPLTVDVMMGLASAAMKRKPTAPARRKPVAKKTPVRKLAAVS